MSRGWKYTKSLRRFIRHRSSRVPLFSNLSKICMCPDGAYQSAFLRRLPFRHINLPFRSDCAIRLMSTNCHENKKNENKGLGNIHFKTNLCSVEELQEFQDIVLSDLTVSDDFITEDEERNLTQELSRFFRRSKYSFDHWDGAIEGFRETEKSNWNDQNRAILARVQMYCFGSSAVMLPDVHVLDLAENGYIKPHIDSSRFCGERIAGLSLLSASVMRFKMPDRNHVVADVLLKPRSLYLMRGKVRYEMTHEILKNEDACWNNQNIPRGRRVSIILREEKEANNEW